MVYKRKRKNVRKQNSKRYRKKNRRVRKPSKALAKTIGKIVDKKLDLKIEDKYKLDSVFSADHSASTWDSSTESCLMNITPTIIEGADVNQRIGKKVTLKHLRVQIRFRPYSNMHVNPTENVTSGDFIFGTNPFVQLPPCAAFVVSLPRETWNSTSSTDLRKALAVKYKEPGVYRQDLEDSDGQKIVKALRSVSQCKISRKYRVYTTFREPYTSTGIDYPQAAVTMSCAQNTNSVIKAKLMKKILFETNEPAQLVYLLYIQCGSKWHDSNYNGSLHRPQNLQTRILWTYEDA